MLKYYQVNGNCENQSRGLGAYPMTRERSAGTVVFRREDGEISYLLLHYATESRHWDFPKGKIEKGEFAHQAAVREVREETGITDLHLLDGFQVEISYYFTRDKQVIYKEVVFFLAETRTAEVRISHEHIGFRWVSYDTALKQLTYENAKEVLRKAHAHLTR